MATTTPNNGWAVPTSTDYVKDGAVAIETLGDAIDASVGTGLLAWTSFTPTFTNFSLGNGTIQRARYAKLGKTVVQEVAILLGSTSSVTGLITVSLPVTAAYAGGRTIWTNHMFAGTATSVGSVNMATTTTVQMFALNTAGTYTSNVSTSSTIPGTWTTSNYFSYQMTYEAA